MSDSETRGEKKRNLLFITSSLYLGGAQKVTSILANSMADRHNVAVAYCFDSGQSHVYDDRCIIRKLPEYAGDDGFFKKTSCVRKQVQDLKALKKELSIDAAVSLGNTANYINALSKGKEKVICCERSSPKKSWGRWFFLTRKVYGKADHIVFQSEQVRSVFGQNIRAKSSILKNPVIIPEPAYEQRKKKIITMGRLTAQKNHALLIRSFAGFHQRFPEYTLHIFGDGELEKDLRYLIGSLGLSGSIILEGDRIDVHERIRDAEMFVLSSDYEGLSNALLECMSMGIACISTKCEGSVDVIQDGENGLITDIGDEKALTRAMCVLAEDIMLRRRLEQQAAEDMKAYDRAVVVRDWEEVIRKAMR